MDEWEPTTITVFGGTGFLGRRIVEYVLRRGFSVHIATRYPCVAHPE